MTVKLFILQDFTFVGRVGVLRQGGIEHQWEGWLPLGDQYYRKVRHGSVMTRVYRHDRRWLDLEPPIR